MPFVKDEAEKMLAKFDMDQYANEQIDKIRNDAEFYEMIKLMGTSENPITLKNVKDNLPKIIDFREDFKFCKNCPGFEKCNKACPHMKISLVFENGEMKKEYSPCDLLVNRLAYSTRFLYKDMPEEWDNNSARSMDIEEGRKKAFMLFQNICNKKATGIYLYGLNGVGKSYVASCFANDYLRKTEGTTVSFLDCLDRFKYLTTLDKSYKEEDKAKFEKILFEIGNTDFLVLDGLGNEVKSDYVRDRILVPLLTERLRKKLPTIVTSNFMISEIVEMYSFSKKGQIHPSAKHLGDLLMAICGTEITLFGKFE